MDLLDYIQGQMDGSIGSFEAVPAVRVFAADVLRPLTANSFISALHHRRRTSACSEADLRSEENPGPGLPMNLGFDKHGPSE